MSPDLIVQTQDRRIAAKAVEAGVTRFLVAKSLGDLGRVEEFRLEGTRIHHNGSHVGEFVAIAGRDDERRVRELKGRRDFVVVETQNWRVIPLENLIAALGGKTKLYAVARNPREAELFLTTMEKGVDGIVVRPRTPAELHSYADLFAKRPLPSLELVQATITRIEPVGMGERVCVDTASTFRAGEGLLVGSSSQGFFLVAAETPETEFVAARPFRVNAGAIHGYVLVGEGTQYLSEVRAGQRLYAVSARGAQREVVVGRAKIETRPLLLIEASVSKRKFSILLQNAETVRLTAPSGRPVSVATLKARDKVLLHPETGARHFGMRVEETIREQ